MDDDYQTPSEDALDQTPRSRGTNAPKLNDLRKNISQARNMKSPTGGLKNPLNAAKALANPSELIPQNAEQAVARLATSGFGPPVITAILILLLLLIVVGIIHTILQLQANQNNPNLPPADITKQGPSLATNGTDLVYSITVSYTGVADDILVTDRIPEGAEFVSATPDAKMFDVNGQTTTNLSLVKSVEWSLKEIQTGTTPTPATPQPSTGTGQKLTFNTQLLSIVLHPLNPDVYIINIASATVVGGVGGAGGGGLPNEDNCGGYYQLNTNPLNKNFGDPSCSMLANINAADKDKLYNLFKEQDPANADFWFFTVTRCASGYNTNAYTQTPDQMGSWGLLQMGPSINGPGTSGDGKNGSFDRGDVSCETLVSNAVNYNNILRQQGQEWRYWQCASSRW